MPVIARDSIASDHLVYAWPFPIGPEEYEVACAEDEQVVMCPAWTVGGLLGPGRHRWRTPTPQSPVSAYFVLTAPVEVSYDMTTTFVLPATGQAVRIRGSGSLQVKCSDASLLIAQFVGLPFDVVNDGILRSVSRSVERMLARLLTRRVVVASTPAAITDPAMLANILEELVAYNPAAGAVFGVELVRMGHLSIAAGDASQPWDADARLDWSGSHPRARTNGEGVVRATTATDEAHGRSKTPTTPPPANPVIVEPPPVPAPVKIPASNPPVAPKRASTQPSLEASGEIVVRQPSISTPPATVPATHPPIPAPPASSAIGSSPGRAVPVTPPPRRATPAVEVPQSTDEITQPGVQIVRTPVPGTLRIGASIGAGPEVASAEETRGSILGIGVAHIGSQVASGEITKKVAPGARVLVPGPNGLMQSATVRQLLQGYYELEVGGSGETIWVPVNGVVPE